MKQNLTAYNGIIYYYLGEGRPSHKDFLEGKVSLHREDGPALVKPYDYQEWYKDGVKYKRDDISLPPVKSNKKKAQEKSDNEYIDFLNKKYSGNLSYNATVEEKLEFFKTYAPEIYEDFKKRLTIDSK